MGVVYILYTTILPGFIDTVAKINFVGHNPTSTFSLEVKDLLTSIIVLPTTKLLPTV